VVLNNHQVAQLYFAQLMKMKLTYIWNKTLQLCAKAYRNQSVRLKDICGLFFLAHAVVCILAMRLLFVEQLGG